MGRPTTHERHDPGVTGGAKRSRWSSLRSGRSLLLFPLAVAVALCWGIVIAVFASSGMSYQCGLDKTTSTVVMAT